MVDCFQLGEIMVWHTHHVIISQHSAVSNMCRTVRYEPVAPPQWSPTRHLVLEFKYYKIDMRTLVPVHRGGGRDWSFKIRSLRRVFHVGRLFL